jgi:hypothetical protein
VFEPKCSIRYSEINPLSASTIGSVAPGGRMVMTGDLLEFWGREHGLRVAVVDGEVVGEV